MAQRDGSKMLLADNHEEQCCPELIALLRQSVQVVVTGLNTARMSDYFFSNYEGKRFQFGRVQAGELLSNIDSMEDELSRYYENAECNFQIIEGMISPVKIRHAEINSHIQKVVSARDIGTSIYGYKVAPYGELTGHSFSGITPAMIYAWIHRLAMAGINTYWTSNYAETARLLVTVYKNEQKPPEQHSTLQRVTLPRLEIRKAEPFMKALMYIGHAYKLEIGEKRAQVLADKFCNIADLAMASVSDVSACDGFGKNSAAKLLAALRGEV